MGEKKISNTLGNIIVALVLSIQFLSLIFNSITGGAGGFIAPMFVLIAILLLVYIFKDLIRNSFVIQKNQGQFFLFVVIILGYILTTILAKGKTNLTTIDYFCRCIIPLVCGMIISFDTKKVFQIMMVFMLPGFPFLTTIFAKANVGSYDAVSMGTSYAILPVISAGVLHFVYFRKSSNLWIKLLYVVTLVYAALFIVKSYRGALLSFLLLFALIYLCSTDKLNKRNFITIIVCINVIFIFILFKSQVLNAINNLLSELGIRIATLEKIAILSSEDDVLHGRLYIYLTALEGIKSSPLFGHGIATFQYYYPRYAFPHNIFLQLLFDYGIPVGLGLIIYIIRNIIVKLRVYINNDKPKQIFLLFLVCCSIPRVLVSAEIWLVISLWFLVGFLSRRIEVYEE